MQPFHMDSELVMRAIIAAISGVTTVLVEMLRRRHRRDMRSASAAVVELERRLEQLERDIKEDHKVDTCRVSVQKTDRAALRKEQDEWLARIRGT